MGYSISDTAHNILNGKHDVTFSNVLHKVMSLLFGGIKENLPTIIKMIAVGIISGIIVSFGEEKNDIGVVAGVAIVSLMGLKSFVFAMTTAEETIDTLFVFVQSLLPSVATAASAAGQGGQMTACGGVFIAMQIFIYICKKIILPLVAVITVISIADKLSELNYLKGIKNMLKSFFKWGIGLLLTLYGVIISIQTNSADIFDTVTGKTVKYAVGSLVPVVGGALSDSLELVRLSGRTIKSVLGLSGIIGIGYVCLNPLINVFTVALGFKLAYGLCSVTAEERITEVINEVGNSMIYVCGVILSVSVMFVISIAMLCRFGGGVIQ